MNDYQELKAAIVNAIQSEGRRINMDNWLRLAHQEAKETADPVHQVLLDAYKEIMPFEMMIGTVQVEASALDKPPATRGWTLTESMSVSVVNNRAVAKFARKAVKFRFTAESTPE